MDSQRFNLTQGDISRKLMLISLPIIGTQLMLMGYNLVDMFLLGRLGAGAVAASGSAGMFMWLSAGLMLIGRMGAEIGVSQAKGARNKPEAIRFARGALWIAAILGCLCGLVCVFFARSLIQFLAIQEVEVAVDAAGYLSIVGMGMPGAFLASAISGVFTGSGNSRAPFIINASGLLLNAVLDPLFIFTVGMGVRGAAVATAIAQLAVCVLSLIWLLWRRDRPFPEFSLRIPASMSHIRQVFRWTIPVSLENILFSLFTMIVARRIASYGADAIAVYRVGSQAESLCWLVCLGFSSGMTTFVGQNFGAGRWTRIWRGFRQGLIFIVSWGIAVSVLFILAGTTLTSLFIPVERIARMGGEYLGILAMCQVFFCLESIAAGAFRGLGKTTPPSVASIISNALRIPIVYLLSGGSLGLNGIWWGVSLTASLRGIWIFTWFILYMRTKPRIDCPIPSGRMAACSSDVPSVRILP